jgi:carboxylate-amine ligase
MMLMPTAAHPWMSPFKETKLWPHDNNEVYSLYDKIFNSRGHGWSNLQSTHLNLPFNGDEEFAKLHAAIRIVLPLLPALCASSPILDEQLSGLFDTRLKFYKTNQAKIPSITGNVIPEAVYSYEEYEKKIYTPIKNDIAPYNQEDILDPIWVNSRGAIARFDRGSIEIRVMDIQECPAADLAIINFVVATLQALVEEKFGDLDSQKKQSTLSLAELFDRTIVTGSRAEIDDMDYLNLFGITQPVSVGDLLNVILEKTTSSESNWFSIIQTILEKGSLSERIIKSIDGDFSHKKLKDVYTQLSECLAENKLFIP